MFAGTTSFEDGLQDALILYDSNIFNLSPDAVEASLKMFDPENVFHESQPEAANRIIRQIASQGFGHLYVTGHSLGGHLAADVTLHNEEVEECMTFDPPGRGEAWFQNWFNSGRTSKIVNYQFVGSPVHMVGHHVGLSLSLVSWGRFS